MTRHAQRFLTAASAAALLQLGASAYAASDQEILDRLDKMQATIDAQQKQIQSQRSEIDTLKKQLKPNSRAGKAPPPSAAAEPVSEPAAVAQPVLAQPASTDDRLAALEAQNQQRKIADREQAKLTFVNGRPTIQSPDGRYSLSIRARTQFDLASYDQDDPGPPETDFRRGSVGSMTNRETTSARDLSSGSNFRRVQFGVEGKIAGDFGYRLIYEFGGSGTEGPARVNEGWISYTGLAPFTLRVGAFAPPANLDDSTGSDDSMFIERASPAELSRALAGADGRYAVGIQANGDRWFAALHLTGATYGDAEVFDEQRAVIGRVAGLVASGADYNVHLGGNVTYVFDPPDQGPDTGLRGPIRFRERPELRVDSTRLIDTGNIDARSAYAAGLEFAANYKNFNLQAEHFWYGITRRDPTLSDPTFTGWYAEGSWIVTGEQRRYQPTSASYAIPRPAETFQGVSGTGAVELAVRYSRTDLDYHAGSAGEAADRDGVRGGIQKIWTLGANWYLNPNIRVTAGYQFVDVDRLNPAGPGNLTPFGPSPATPPIGADIGQTYRVLSARFQFTF